MACKSFFGDCKTTCLISVTGELVLLTWRGLVGKGQESSVTADPRAAGTQSHKPNRIPQFSELRRDPNIRAGAGTSWGNSAHTAADAGCREGEVGPGHAADGHL